MLRGLGSAVIALMCCFQACSAIAEPIPPAPTPPAPIPAVRPERSPPAQPVSPSPNAATAAGAAAKAAADAAIKKAAIDEAAAADADAAKKAEAEAFARAEADKAAALQDKAAALPDKEVTPPAVEPAKAAAAPVVEPPKAAAQPAPPTEQAAAPKPDLKEDAPPPAAADPTPAKKLFGAVKSPAPLAARAIGTYARGCLAGAKPLAVDGPTWQAMRLSRNRRWGHPDLIALMEKFASEVKQDGWPGLLVGDISQPRGGPMLTGHASHQLGLDADIWFTPMPDRRLSDKERETLSATSMLAKDNLSVDPAVWTESRVKIIKRVASYPKVERVLVHPAIKKALCQATPADADRKWLAKVRPYWGHFYHFHVRIGCPGNSPDCKPQAPIPGDDGCAKELDDWFQLLTRKPKPPQPKPKDEQVAKKPVKPKPPMSLDQLPADCRDVLALGGEVKVPPKPVIASTVAKPAAAKPADVKALHPDPAKKPAHSTKSAASSPAAAPADDP